MGGPERLSFSKSKKYIRSGEDIPKLLKRGTRSIHEQVERELGLDAALGLYGANPGSMRWAFLDHVRTLIAPGEGSEVRGGKYIPCFSERLIAGRT